MTAIVSNKFLGRNRFIWLLFALTLLTLAGQCNPVPTPPLPASPTGATIRIALLAPAAGDLTTVGQTMRNGIVMALDEQNARGGLLGHRIEWTVYNTNCQFETAQVAIQQAIDDRIKFVIGPLCSEEAIAAAVVAEAEEVLLISPTAMHPLVTVSGQGLTRPTVFRVSYGYRFQGQAAARFAIDTLGASKAALFSNPVDDYTNTLAKAFAEQFSAQRGEIVYQATFTPEDSDFREQLMAIGMAEADVIYLPAAATVANQVANQLKELESLAQISTPDKDPILLGSDSFESMDLDLVATAGSYFTTHFALDDERPIVGNWIEAYKSSYAMAPNAVAALGYDAALILTTAIEQADTFDPTAVAKTLELGTFRGVTGDIAFDSQHGPFKPVPVVQIREDRIVYSTSIQVVPAAVKD